MPWGVSSGFPTSRSPKLFADEASLYNYAVGALGRRSRTVVAGAAVVAGDSAVSVDPSTSDEGEEDAHE